MKLRKLKYPERHFCNEIIDRVFIKFVTFGRKFNLCFATSFDRKHERCESFQLKYNKHKNYVFKCKSFFVT